MVRASAAAALLCTVGGCASVGGLPPLWETESGLPGDAVVTRAVFGLWERRALPDGSTHTTLHPFGTYRASPGDESALHVLPPLYERTRTPTARSRTVLPLYFERSSGTDRQVEEGRADDDTWLFPLAAWGSEPSEGRYTMLLPFGGTLKGKLLADEITIRGFPFWIEVRSDDWHATHVLWPLIAWGEGETRSHFRALPFWSQTDGAHVTRRSLLWPFIHWNSEVRGDRRLDGWMVFPLAARRASEDGTSLQWSVLYPFFQFARDTTNGDSYVAAPWPFFKRSVRPGVEESTWLWPFWGHTETEDASSSFYVWPIGWHQAETRAGIERRRTYVVPLYAHSESGPVGGEPNAEALRSWPLVAWQRDAAGHCTGRVPDLLPTFGWEPGERVYSDLLSLVRWESDAAGRGAWDAPLGIVRYRRDAAGERSLTLLWWLRIPLGSDS